MIKFYNTGSSGREAHRTHIREYRDYDKPGDHRLGVELFAGEQLKANCILNREQVKVLYGELCKWLDRQPSLPKTESLWEGSL